MQNWPLQIEWTLVNPVEFAINHTCYPPHPPFICVILPYINKQK